VSAKNAPVRITKTRSDIACTPVVKWLDGDHQEVQSKPGVTR
jgi:hypothetical protein